MAKKKKATRAPKKKTVKRKKAKATKKAAKKKTAKKKKTVKKKPYAVPATGPLKLMVASTVYGFETEINQLCAVLKTYGYDVLNSHFKTIRVPHGKSNNQACLDAVGECHVFLGVIRQFYGSGITHNEINEAKRLDRPRWFVAHAFVPFSRQVFRQFKKTKKQKKTLPISIPFAKTPVMDNLKVVEMYEDAIHVDGPDAERKWAQEFCEFSDLLKFVETNFKDHEWVRSECLKGVRP